MGDVGIACRFSYCMPELLQNCDLPPPKQQHKLDQQNAEFEQNQILLKALQRSQTRAREARRKAVEARTATERVAALLMKDSLRLHAARQWVRLLEMEISLLDRSPLAEEKDEDFGDEAATWCLASALCLGFVAAGFMLGTHIF